MISINNKILKNYHNETDFNKLVNDKKVYIETYGCQMNYADTEILLSILSDNGYNKTDEMKDSDVILLNTCAIRDNAEKRIHSRLEFLNSYKRNNPNVIIGVLGCMAERLREKIMNSSKAVDLVIGPDEYRKLPQLIESTVETGERGVAVKLSKVETYDDITPLRKDGITAFISIMRGCDKFCTFCVVPFTRGRERSSKLKNIVDQIKMLYDDGIKDVSLLGQNVNSYNDGTYDFSDLLAACAKAVPEMRIRYTTSHPYDLSVKLLETMSSFKNICKFIHLPVQSGSDRILKLMNRNYTIEHYMKIMETARIMMPGIGLSTDIITGFPTESDDDHKRTLEVIENVRYDGAYMFAYSPRENTKAYKMNLIDDVKEETKKIRLNEIIDSQRRISLEINRSLIGTELNVLIENVSKKSEDYLMGRTDCNKSVIIPRRKSFIDSYGNLTLQKNYLIGDFVNVKITKANSATLFADPF
jgi:tRNA-2-methylthio-N6-dimethylallyladenosine synthase